MTIIVPLNSQGEIIDCQEADQFQPTKTQFACGFFSCAIARSMVRPGSLPTLTIAQVIADGLAYYREFDGSDAITNTNGMTNAQLWSLLHEIGLHYQETATDATILKQWVFMGYPVIVAVTEVSVEDGALGANPYPWHAAGTHIVLLTGISSKGNFLVRDSANCTSLTNPNTLRPGPREYTAAKLQVVSATVAVPPWLPRPASATPPTEPPIQVLANLTIPQGWTDNGVTLKAPNGIEVIGDFRVYVLTHPWNPGNHPVAAEESVDPVELAYVQPDGVNTGTRQIFWYTELARTAKRPAYVVSMGREFNVALHQIITVSQIPAIEGPTVSAPTTSV